MDTGALSFITNAALSLTTAAMLIIIALNMRRRMNLLVEGRVFFVTVCVCISVLLLEAITWLLDGVSGGFMRVLLYILCILYNCGTSFLAALWVLYVILRLYGEKRYRLTRFWLMSPMVLIFISQALSPWLHGCFYLDAFNVYVRGPWYMINIGLCGIYCLGAFALPLIHMFRCSTAAERRECAYLTGFVIMPIAGSICQTLFYGLALTWSMGALSLLMIFINLQNKEIEQQKTAIMLSQIQPHFMFNSLAAIGHLCEKDPAEASTAVMEFSKYLRGNIDALSNEHCISFDKELDHVKTYLSIEKRRYGDRLNVEYSIQTVGFLLPPLTLQPIVENAVRHGIAKKQGGGTVKIATEELPKAIRITVADDGAGFDPDNLYKDGKVHVGLQSVRIRLAALCRGTLSYTTELGKGTMMTITIPK